LASFRKRGSTWQYRIKYIDPLTHDSNEVSKCGFKTKKEAQHAASKEEIAIHHGLELDSKNVPLKLFLREWLLEYKKENVRKNTYILHERNVETKIIPYFKDIYLKDLTPLRCQKFVNYLSEQDYSKRTIEIIHGTLSNAMEVAVRPLKKINENPCKGTIIPNKNAKQKTSLQYIKSDDISHFFKVARQDDYVYYMFFKTLLETGLRKGEAAALQRKDIDFKENTIDVNKTLDFHAKPDEELFGQTKTYDSIRKIKMNESLAKELLKHMDYLNTQRIVYNDVYFHDLDLIFCRSDGNFLPKSTLFNSFNRINRKANLNKLPIHSLRHTHAVLLLESGASMKFVQERLGHKNITITSDVYSHISDKIEKTSVDDYENYMKNLMS
jgi:integrase